MAVLLLCLTSTFSGFYLLHSSRSALINKFNMAVRLAVPYSTQKATTDFTTSLSTMTTLQSQKTLFINVSSGEMCNEVSNFVFVKTHKTGSTTLRSLTCRYGYFRNLSFLLGKQGVIGHLNQLNLVWTQNESNLLPPIGVSVEDHLNHRNYNISNIHVRYNGELIRKLMYRASDLKYFTILRNPTNQWLSQFQYFGQYRKAGLSLSSLPQTLIRYLKKLKERTGGFNNQLRDLGIHSSIAYNSSWLNETIPQIDKEYDLVLIMEHFDESLILLKKLLCWSFKDILYVKKRQQPNPLKINEATRKEIQKRNVGDEALYDYFLKVFWSKVEDYGPSFQKDLNQFRKMLNETWHMCVGKTVAEKSQDHYRYLETYVTDNSSEFCWALVNTNFQMDIEIVKRQGKTSDDRWPGLLKQSERKPVVKPQRRFPLRKGYKRKPSH